MSLISLLKLLDFVATKIYKINEPSSSTASNPHKDVDDLVEFVDWYASSEVIEAVMPLVTDYERFEDTIARMRKFFEEHGLPKATS